MNAQILETIKNNFTVSLFKTDEVSEKQFPITTEVVGLSTFQMPMIYHHLQEGVELSLYYNYSASASHRAVEVHFKGFKLGYLPFTTANLIEKVLMHGFELNVKVVAVEKQKYMPINRLDIQITENYLY